MIIRYKTYSNSRDIIDWCHNNIGPYGYGWRWVNSNTIDFKIEIDDEKLALLFLLRWA